MRPGAIGETETETGAIGYGHGRERAKEAVQLYISRAYNGEVGNFFDEPGINAPNATYILMERKYTCHFQICNHCRIYQVRAIRVEKFLLLLLHVGTHW